MCDEVFMEAEIKIMPCFCAVLLGFPETLLSILSHSILKAIVGNSQASHYHPHYTDEDTEIECKCLPKVK